MKLLVEKCHLVAGGVIVCYWNGSVRNNKWFATLDEANAFIIKEGIA